MIDAAREYIEKLWSTEGMQGVAFLLVVGPIFLILITCWCCRESYLRRVEETDEREINAAYGAV